MTSPVTTTPALTEQSLNDFFDVTSNVTLRPSYEGGNISTTIGFKCVHYLIEAAVLEHFRSAGLGATDLYVDYGVGFDVVSVNTRLHTVLTLDDAVAVEVKPVTKETDSRLRFKITAYVPREEGRRKAVTTTFEVALRAIDHVEGAKPLPEKLSRFVVPRLGQATPREITAVPVDNIDLASQRGIGTRAADPVLTEIIGGDNAFGWKWRVPYFYCHFTSHMQMSGFLRQMEEVLHLFVADRGIAIHRLLEERSWIPVVTKCDVEITDEVRIEDELYTVFTIEDIFKSVLFTARMDCYVVRDGGLVQVSTGHITHGYVTKESPEKDWSLCTFDEEVMAALSGKNLAGN
uniref:Putative thioesterase n=1 Tax=Streptomyces sp. Acta 2897 TaxID=1001349 RepID=F2YRX6_9ACTN|nr:putative thioesterase [Streptomyces sp. Acta 2897]